MVIAVQTKVFLGAQINFRRLLFIFMQGVLFAVQQYRCDAWGIGMDITRYIHPNFGRVLVLGEKVFNPVYGEGVVNTDSLCATFTCDNGNFVDLTIDSKYLFPYPVVIVKADEPYTPPATPKVAPPKFTAVRVWCGEGDAEFIRVSAGLLTDDNSMLLCYCSHGNDINDPEFTPWENWEVLQ